MGLKKKRVKENTITAKTASSELTPYPCPEHPMKVTLRNLPIRVRRKLKK